MDLKGFVQYIPKVDKTLTLDGECADAKVVGDILKDKVNCADVADNLTTEDGKKVLSARMGVWLKNDIEKISKQHGSYVGNGNATERQITVGGIGGWLGVCSGSYMVGVITQNGAFFFNTTDSTVHCFKVSQAKYIGGVLTISSDDGYLNGNGNTYHYQVL